MAITLTGTGGLFTRLGKIGKAIRDINTFQGTTAPAFISGIMGQYDSLRPAVADVPPLQSKVQGDVALILPTLQAVARETLYQMVLADTPSASLSLETQLRELVRQMNGGPTTVKASTVGLSVGSLSIGSPSWNGVLVTSTKRGDGLVQELIIPEVGRLVCSQDSQTGGATAGNEVFTYTGEPASTSAWDSGWPEGSGAATSLTAIDGGEDAGLNLLTNSDFETFVSNTPSRWVLGGAYAGTLVRESTAQFFDGAKSVEFVGDATTNLQMEQTFADSINGTSSVLFPERSYAINLWLKVNSVPAAGVITVSLVDGSGTVINDSQGTANSFTISAPGLTTSWASRTGVFRLPRVLPDVVKLRIRATTAISSGTSVFMDRAAMGSMVTLYAGGPLAAIFSGSSKFIGGDGWEITATNDRGGATLGSTFQALFDRLFGTRQLGILLPSAGSPTIADTLITS
ncbi:hypothetical protein [Tuwongella immobilis]|uniref:Uncharacterized protein n=1 Tax=Tuwongella immobilis TaxID=692036 RepID=A0A6C2YLQ0_9BACT|nr:hypothetical protein [Tuwongella immobilis]VIP02159.1 Uncharacterized protein OS=Blastopirellula marina DSM 3645 GN=DSM3645_15245 PE=4 SV=1 [Tuwongella immobilis]VIP05592.1 Uncharacterized protein OS=Blastopirellula marina DSM 3645 GN=DSM3645_15245 PE=4 SV=1 [Tuwongella immobilis]VTS00564.1 Uncharacterized protein OS=Blastopirellula marina DSM 3645 GN=DSM3645_15245 PE=4 SV=1 [Tuwongella immobilis]VTS08539.1 Uncharacterized protein OS=Blastopirellula marina DSM 3645 GN=DSM3645_15245 PE=4 SV=1